MKQLNFAIPILLLCFDNVVGREWIRSGENADDRGYKVKRDINETRMLLIDDMFFEQPENYQQSLVIVFDDTGSMQDDWVQLRKAVKRIVNTYASLKEKPIFDYILVRFNDPIIRPSHHTRDPHNFTDVLDRMLVMGGDDCAELTFHGIMQGMRASLKYSHIYVFTDASAKDNEYFNITLEIARMKQLKVSFIVTGKDCQGQDFQLFRSLARQTHGNFYQLNKANVEEAIVGIADGLESGTIPIVSIYSDMPASDRIPVSVDSLLKKLTVTLIGEEQEFRIINPHNVEDSHTKVLLQLDSVKMAKVEHPQPGKWHVEYNASSEHSLKITGATDNLYRYGFSYIPPKELSDTTLNPIKGIRNYLAIFVWGDKQQNNLTSVEIVVVSPETEISYANYTLRAVDADNSDNDFRTYTTDSFDLPTNTFKIYVHGTDSKGFPLKYLLSINIEATDGETLRPKITIDAKDIKAIEGENVRLVCKVKSHKRAVINWIFQDKIIEDSYKTRVSFKKNDTVQLDLLGVNVNDIGNYFCQANSAFGQHYEKVFVNVTLLPWDVQLIPKDLHAIENDLEKDLEIKCIVNPRNRKVSIKWLHDKRNLSETKDIQISERILTIKKVTRHHQGNYTCKASYDRVIKTASGSLTVFYQPEIAGPQFERHVVKFGDRVELNCSAIGNPKPSISWIRADSNKTAITVIESFAPIHLGTYRCDARNGVGISARKIVVLETKYGLKPIVETVSDKISVVEGDSVAMTCKVDGPGSMESAWRLNGKDDQLGNRTEIKKSLVTTTLTITDSRVDDSGEYICSFRNSYGIDEKTISLQVTPKQLKIAMKDQFLKVEEGTQNYVIECLVSPKDRKIIWMWMSGDRILHNSTEFQIVGAKLIIKTVKRTQSGKYICMGEFYGQIRNATGFLDVLYPPEIIGPAEETKVVKFDDEVALDCTAIGNPAPTIFWDRNSTLTSDHRIIRFSPSHYGTYTCTASNGVGTPAIKRVFLDSKPKGSPKLIHSQFRNDIMAGQNDTLICKCQACGPITYKSWKRIRSNWSMAIADIEGTLDGRTKNFEFNLNLIGAKLSDSGYYECTIGNEYGNSRSSMHVNVLGAPAITNITPDGDAKIENQRLIMKVGKYLKLTCNSFGNPKPTISWYKDGKKIHQLDEYVGDTIQFESVEEKDMGRYTCQAINKFGEASSHIDLHVIHVNLPMNTIMISDEGQIVTLPCNSHVIFFNDDLINVNSSRYKILDGYIIFTATYEDSGVYRCIVPTGSTFEEIETVLMIQNPPRIFPIIDDTIFATENKDVILSCRAEGNPMPKIAWSVNGKNIEKSTSYKYLPGGALLVQKLKKIHEGGYVCHASNRVGHSERRTNLIITELPRDVENADCQPQQTVKNDTLAETDIRNLSSFGNFTVEIAICPTKKLNQREEILPAIQSKHHLVEGENLNLRCPFVNDGTLKWYKDDDEFLSDRTDNTTFFSRLSVRTEDTGTYACITSGLNGKKFTHNVKVFRSDDPYVHDDYYDQIVIKKIGDNLTLDCEDGRDIPIETKWLQKDRVISTAKKLDFKSLKVSETGKYVCKDVHDAGLIYQAYFILVEGPPRVLMPKDNWIAINDGDSLELECLITGHPTPNVVWMRNGKLLPLNRTIFFVEKSNSSDHGTYTCFGANRFGNASVHYHVDILRKPQIKVFSHGDSGFELKCQATGNPIPAIIWTFNGRKLFEWDSGQVAKNKSLLKTDFGEQFYIHGKATEEKILTLELINRTSYAGIYNCYAINGVGMAEAEIKITTIDPPQLLYGNQTSTSNVLVDLPLFLQCPWKEESVTVVTWQKDSDLLNDGVSYDKKFFSIPAIQHDDKGVFTCSAKNNAGLGTKSVVVNVKGPHYYGIDDESDDVVLKCPELDGPDWLFVWEEFFFEDGNVTYTLPEYSTDLIIDTGRPSSIFTCYHEDEITGDRVKKLEVQIIKTSPLKYYETTRYVNVAHANRLRCPLHLDDTRDLVVWFKDDLRLTTVPNGFFSENGAVLNIGFVSQDDEATYKCRTSAGKIERGIVLKMNPAKAQWSDWQPWTACSKSCDGGIQTRERACFVINSKRMKPSCVGENIEIRACNIFACPMNGNWSEWSAWSTCNEYCKPKLTGKPIKSRTRNCDSPAPSMGGLYCVGPANQEQVCDAKECD